MKKNLLAMLLCLSASVAFTNQSSAQGTLIHYWHFNTLTSSDSIMSSLGCTAATVTNNFINPIDADFSLISTASTTVLYRVQPGVSATWPTTTNDGTCFTYYDSYPSISTDLDTVNLRMSDTGGNCLRTRNPSDSMELLFYIPTTHFNHILLKYGCERSGSGMLEHDYAYSLDSGVTFITTGLTATSNTVNTAFSLFSVPLTSIAGASDNARLVFRIRFTGNNNTSNGNNRFDNITVDGDPMSGLAINELSAAPVYTIYPNPAAGQIFIQSALNGEKTVTICNMISQKVYEGVNAGTNFSINTSALNAGVYSISIHDNTTGNVSTSKFTKQ